MSNQKDFKFLSYNNFTQQIRPKKWSQQCIPSDGKPGAGFEKAGFRF